MSKVGLFSGLTQKQLNNIAKSGTERKFNTGDVIVKEGEKGVGFYLLLDGKVEVRKKSKLITTLATGDVFGEMGLIDDKPRSADVVALSPTNTFCLSAWAFSGIVTGNPDIALNMMKVLVGRIRSSDLALTE
jgi:CRP/FNR family transcriptional regulator, cyclic AMP receptor protein